MCKLTNKNQESNAEALILEVLYCDAFACIFTPFVCLSIIGVSFCLLLLFLYVILSPLR